MTRLRAARAAFYRAFGALAVILLLFGSLSYAPKYLRDAIAQVFTIPDGSYVAGHVAYTQPTAPPVGVGCTIVAGATDMEGSCTASAASGSITFGRTFTNAPTCIVADAGATSTVSMPVYTVSATAITLTTIISTHLLVWHCAGKTGST